jgi:hypothetical protein
MIISASYANVCNNHKTYIERQAAATGIQKRNRNTEGDRLPGAIVVLARKPQSPLTGPVWSMLSLLSIPIFLLVGVVALVRALETGRLPVIYGASVAVVLVLALVWFVLRRLANNADIARAQKVARRLVAGAERFIR